MNALQGIPQSETTLTYTYESGKQFSTSTSNQTISGQINDKDNSAWKVGTTSVVGYKQIRLTQYTYEGCWSNQH